MANIRHARADFPALEQQIHGHPLTYLDSGASALKPRSVVDRLSKYYAREHSNVHRGAHLLSQQATDLYEGARERIARYINAAESREVIFTRGTTEGINLVANAYVRERVGSGDEILVSGLEHHSNMVPWHMICQEKGATLRIIPVNDVGELVLDDLDSLLTPRTRLVAVTHISNSLGTIVPLERIIGAAHSQDIPVLVDGAQGVPHSRVDMQSLDVDFYCFSGHKTYGPTGIGILYGKTTLLEEATPWQGGGDMIHTVSYSEYTPDTLPHKFEAGTPHIAGTIGLASAIDYMESIGVSAIAEHENTLLHYAQEQLSALGGVQLVGTAPHKAAVISFLVENTHPYDIGRILDERGVAVRVGHHCTMPLMERLNIPGTVRASLGLYNSHEDIDRLVQGVDYAKMQLLASRSSSVRISSSAKSKNTFKERMDSVLDDLDLFDSPDEKREYLMEFGEALPAYSDAYRTEDYRIHGCQSMVWLRTELKQNRLHFMADSDALITRGMIALLVHLLDGLTPVFVNSLNLGQVISQLGLPSLVTAQRKNGLANMVARISKDAQRYGTSNHR